MYICLSFSHIHQTPKIDWESFIQKYPETFQHLFTMTVFMNFATVFKIRNRFNEKREGKIFKPDIKRCRDFEYLFLNPVFSDIDLEVQGEILKGHKSVLSSKFF
jgi:hypothetical protein